MAPFFLSPKGLSNVRDPQVFKRKLSESLLLCEDLESISIWNPSFLTVVLDYIEMLDEVDTEGVDETCQVTGLEDIVRSDEERGTSDEEREKLLDLFPEKMGDLLKVKGVFDS